MSTSLTAQQAAAADAVAVLQGRLSDLTNTQATLQAQCATLLRSIATGTPGAEEQYLAAQQQLTIIGMRVQAITLALQDSTAAKYALDLSIANGDA